MSGEALRAPQNEDHVGLRGDAPEHLQGTVIAQVHQGLAVDGEDDVAGLDEAALLRGTPSDQVGDDHGWLAHPLLHQEAQAPHLALEEADGNDVGLDLLNTEHLTLHGV